MRAVTPALVRRLSHRRPHAGATVRLRSDPLPTGQIAPLWGLRPRKRRPPLYSGGISASQCGFKLNSHLPISNSAIRGFGNSFWMDVVEMVAISSLIGSPRSMLRNDRLASGPDRKERVEHYRHRSRAMFESADTATSDEARREFIRLATEWLKLASEISLPHRKTM
jgi:hypothetical protein